jgi:predicted ATPase
MSQALWRVRLIGRSAELAELESERRKAATGDFRCIVVQADPGVGKTRLISEFLSRNSRRMTTMSARGYPLGGTVSFGLWAQATTEGTSRRSRTAGTSAAF